MIDSPTLIIDLLATALPQEATYFMQISFVSTVISGGMELLRVVPIALAVIRAYVGPRLTEKEQRTSFIGIRPLYDPMEFEHADFTSQAVSLKRWASMSSNSVKSLLTFLLRHRYSTSWSSSCTRQSPR
jgi:hypothetical protein